MAVKFEKRLLLLKPERWDSFKGWLWNFVSISYFLFIRCMYVLDLYHVWVVFQLFIRSL